MDYLSRNYESCLKQGRQFQQALDDYLDIEGANADAINKTGPDGPPEAAATRPADRRSERASGHGETTSQPGGCRRLDRVQYPNRGDCDTRHQRAGQHNRSDTVHSAGSPVESPLGSTCEWRNEETHGNAQVRFLDKDPRGLSAEYKADKDGKWEFFDELPPIDGFPAVVRLAADQRDIGACTVVVGVSDEVAFEVPLQLSQVNVGAKDPCDAAVRVAGLALETMKKG